MKLEKLKLLRTYVPAIFLALLVQLYKTDNIAEFKAFFGDLMALNVENIFKFAIYIAFGFIYNSFKWRRFLFNPYLKKVQYNIKSKLLILLKTKEYISDSEGEKFLASSKGMNIFYRLIDNDVSLSNKSEIIKHNGVLWSSLTDCALLSFVFFILELIKVLIFRDAYYLLISAILLVVCIISLILNHLAVKQHIELSNEQLEIIGQQFIENLYTEYKR